MNQNFYEIIKQAGKSPTKYFDLFRGWNNKAGYHKGIFEKQHPELWKKPDKGHSLSHIGKVLFDLHLSPTEFKLAVNVICHTWSFFKATEFISKKQFINGKYNSYTGECLVGPANISPSSFAKAMDRVIKKGVIRRIAVSSPFGPKTLYATNPFMGGKIINDIDQINRAWKHSSYPEIFQEFIDLIQSTAIPFAIENKIPKYDLFEDLIERLCHVELLPLIMGKHKNDYPEVLNLRKEWGDRLDKEILPNGSTNKPDSYEVKNPKLFFNLLQEALDEVNESEREWLESETIKKRIDYLKNIRIQIDQPLTASLNFKDAEMQAILLYFRWGDTLLTLSIDAWERFEYLIKEFGTVFNSYLGKIIIEKYDLMKKERENIPWVKKSVDTYFKCKKPVKKVSNFQQDTLIETVKLSTGIIN